MRTPVALLLAVLLIPALGLAGAGVAQAQPLQVSPVPIWGVVLGTVVFAGLLYLIVHGPDGAYYRYPYYGQYYQYYYRPAYRPYTGFWPAAAPLVTVAPAIAGTVLGLVVINNVNYILSRDASGHLYRYPYYGPYRQFYYTRYRANYQPYHGSYVANGAYRSAPVRQGDARWDGDHRMLAPAYQRPGAARPAYQPHQPGPTPQRPNSTYQRQPSGSQHQSGSSQPNKGGQPEPHESAVRTAGSAGLSE
jgi:hypothetical protein